MLVDLSSLFLSNTSDLYNEVLKDNIWQKATFYHLSTDSVFWNTAALICLPKAYAFTPPVALLYLLQKEAKTLTLWQEQWSDSVPSSKEFIQALINGGRFSNTTGETVSIESFWKEFKGTNDGIIAERSFQFSINETAATYKELLSQEDIRDVVCFDNTWQEQNYFIETSKEWLLYHWATGA